MLDLHASAAVLLALACALFGVVVFMVSRYDYVDKPVRLNDKRTWRRQSAFWRANWPHVIFPVAIMLGVTVYLASN